MMITLMIYRFWIYTFIDRQVKTSLLLLLLEAPRFIWLIITFGESTNDIYNDNINDLQIWETGALWWIAHSTFWQLSMSFPDPWLARIMWWWCQKETSYSNRSYLGKDGSLQTLSSSWNVKLSHHKQNLKKIDTAPILPLGNVLTKTKLLRVG